MNSNKGIAYIPVLIVILIVVGAVAAVYFEVPNKIFNKTVFDPKVDTVISQEEVGTDAEEVKEEKSETSAFGKLMENKETSAECDLKKYMSHPDLEMEFNPIMQEFSNVRIDYPEDWPEDMVYPEEFKLVEAISGEIIPDDPKTLTHRTEHIYEGSAVSAACSLIKYFENNGWNVLDMASFEDLGFTIIVASDKSERDGLITMETDTKNPSQTKVIIVR